MRYHQMDPQTQRTPKAYQPCHNEHRPTYRFPPLRLKHLAVAKANRDYLAELRLQASGYDYDAANDVWTKDKECDCVVKNGYVLTLTPASIRHLSS